jgi:acetyl esterase/lipase
MRIWILGLVLTGVSQAVVIERNLPYQSGLLLDVYRPERVATPPVIVMVHGGGWRHGSKDGYDQPMRWAVDAGYAAVAMNYRLDTPHPAAQDDVAAAIAWTRQRFPRSPVYLFGESAGGHLALMNARDARRVAVFYAPTDLDLMVADTPDEYLKECVRVIFGAQTREASPLTALGPDYPPVYLLHGDADRVVPVNQAHAFGERARALGVQVRTTILAGEGHGFTPQKRQSAFQDVFRFFAR